MSVEAGAAAAALRAGAAALLATAAGCAVLGGLRRATPSGRAAALGVLGALLVTPWVWLGYGWSSLLLAPHRAIAEGALVALLAAKLIPVAAGVRAAAPPPPMRATGEFLLSVHGAASRARQTWWRSRFGSLRPVLWTGGVVFVFAFGDFELTVLLGLTSWTSALFDAHAGGQPAVTGLRAAGLPLAVVGIPVLAIATSARATAREAAGPSPAAARNHHAVTWTVLGGALVLALLVPAWVVTGRGVSADAWTGTLTSARTWSDLGRSAMGAALAAFAALELAAAAWRSRARAWLAPLLCAPGCAGGLVVALTVQSGIDSIGLGALHGTPLPWLAALTVIAMPPAVLLVALDTSRRDRADVHQARLLPAGPGRRALLRRLTGAPRVLAFAVLFATLTFEVVASAVLAPPGAPPVAVRLYNLMHYGHSDALSASLLIAITAVWTALAAVTMLWAGSGRVPRQAP